MSVEISLRHEFPGFALDIAFALPGAGVTALFGASGAGKTTIVNAIAGAFRPREGRVVIDGRIVLDTAAGVFVPPEQRRTGYVFEDARLFPHMTVENNLLFGWRRAASKASAGRHRPRHRPARPAAAVAASPACLVRRREEPRRAGPRAVVLAANPPARRAPGLARRPTPPRNPALSGKTARRSEAADAVCQPLARRGRASRRRHRCGARGPAGGARLGVRGPDGAGVARAGRFAAGRRRHPGDDNRASGRRSHGARAFDGGTLFVARLAHCRWARRLRVRLRAEDIMLALEEPRAISANNMLPARVLALGGDGGTQADVQLGVWRLRGWWRGSPPPRRRDSAWRCRVWKVFAIVKSVTVDANRP